MREVTTPHTHQTTLTGLKRIRALSRSPRGSCSRQSRTLVTSSVRNTASCTLPLQSATRRGEGWQAQVLLLFQHSRDGMVVLVVGLGTYHAGRGDAFSTSRGISRKGRRAGLAEAPRGGNTIRVVLPRPWGVDLTNVPAQWRFIAEGRCAVLPCTMHDSAAVEVLVIIGAWAPQRRSILKISGAAARHIRVEGNLPITNMVVLADSAGAHAILLEMVVRVQSRVPIFRQRPGGAIVVQRGHEGALASGYRPVVRHRCAGSERVRVCIVMSRRWRLSA